MKPVLMGKPGWGKVCEVRQEYYPRLSRQNANEAGKGKIMKQAQRLLLACILNLGALAASPILADTIILINGNTVTGTILQTNGDNLVVMTDYGTLKYSRMIVKEIKTTQAEAFELQRKARLPGSKDTICALSQQAWASNLEQIPATVIDNGILKNVPYVSYRCGGDYEVNIYGDLENPAGVEVGVYRKLLEDPSAKSNCIAFICSVLAETADREIVRQLDTSKDLKTARGLSFEITPPSAADAYMGWWVSVYDERKLNLASASDDELKRITITKDEVAKQVDQSSAAWTRDELKLARPASPRSDTISFTTKAGVAVTNAQVVRVNEGVSLLWRDGSTMGTVMLVDLPEDLRVRYGYDPRKAEAAAALARNNDLAWQQQQALAQRAAQTPAKAGQYLGSDAGYSSGGGSVYVRGYTRKDGTYVHSYSRRR